MVAEDSERGRERHCRNHCKAPAGNSGFGGKSPPGRGANVKGLPEAEIDAGYEVYEQSLDLPDPNDRHVLAAAIHCRASTIVTDNLKDFPAVELARHGIEAKSADDFIADEMDLDIIKAVGVVRNMRIRLKRPTISASDLLLKMEARGLTETTRLLRPYEDLI